MKVFICSVLVCISLVSTAVIATYLLLRLLMPRQKCGYFICVPCDESTKNLRKTAYSVRLKLNLCGESENNVLVIVDNGMNEKELEDVSNLCREKCGITIVNKDDLKEFINERF